jgi:hypothetical protein
MAQSNKQAHLGAATTPAIVSEKEKKSRGRIYTLAGAHAAFVYMTKAIVAYDVPLIPYCQVVQKVLIEPEML